MKPSSNLLHFTSFLPIATFVRNNVIHFYDMIFGHSKSTFEQISILKHIRNKNYVQCIAFLAPACDPNDPKKFDFSQISMIIPPILFQGLKMS